MATDWRTLCSGDPRFDFDGDDVLVVFENGRRHRVRVQETADTFELHAIVARAGAVKEVPDLPLRIWRHNRAAQSVGFRLDTKGRVLAQGWVAKDGLSAEEFQFVLRRVASNSDRLEFLLTGRDAE